jgi:hypothetical protein
MWEHRPGSDGITSGDEAMGTNGNIFPVQRLRCELEILDDIWGNTEALRQRLQVEVSEYQGYGTKDVHEDWTYRGSQDRPL